MNTAARSQPPSLAELVRAISEEVPVPAVPAPMVMQMPRPHPLSRLLLITAVMLCALLATMLYGLTHHVQNLMADIRLQEAERANPALAPLPSTERLLDPSIFAMDCAARPAEVGRLHAARAHALVAAQRPLEAIDGFALASQWNDAPLAAVDRVALGEALLATGRADEARTLLLGIDMTDLSDDLRARSNDVLGRVVMAQRQAERLRPLAPVAQ